MTKIIIDRCCPQNVDFEKANKRFSDEKKKKELSKSNKQQKLLCYLIEGTRGGKTRALVMKNLLEKSYNAHQLAKVLNKDYKTIRHHLQVLVRNGIVISKNDGNRSLYYISKTIESDFAEMNTEYKQ